MNWHNTNKQHACILIDPSSIQPVVGGADRNGMQYHQLISRPAAQLIPAGLASKT